MAAAYPFSLERPATIDETVALLAAADGDARIMAGGQSLTPLLSLGLSSPETIVSLDRCTELDRIDATDARIDVGAMVTTAAVERSEAIEKSFPLVATAARRVGSPHVRNFGTAVGNVCHGDPGSDLIPALLCYAAVVNLQSPTASRSIGVEDFLTGPFSTSIADTEMATSLTLARDESGGWQHGYRKLVKRSGDLAMATCAVRLQIDAGVIRSARIALGGALSRARRLPTVEAALDSAPATQAAERVLVADWSSDVAADLMGDAHAPLDYLQVMLPRFLAATVADAVVGAEHD